MFLQSIVNALNALSSSVNFNIGGDFKGEKRGESFISYKSRRVTVQSYLRVQSLHNLSKVFPATPPQVTRDFIFLYFFLGYIMQI